MEEYFPGSTKRKDTMVIAGQKIIPVKTSCHAGKHYGTKQAGLLFTIQNDYFVASTN
jgi:hypothetical protein